MSIEKILLSEHSKEAVNEAIKWVDGDVEKFNSLIQCVLGENKLLAQRAAWPMSYIVEDYPSFIYPYLNTLLDLVKQPVHDAIKRNTFRFLKEIAIPKKYLSKTIDTCLFVIDNKKEPIAVIAFAFYTLLRIAKSIPEIKNEILFATELYEDHDSPALKHTIKRVRQELS
jgi:hypothetical protein